VRFVIPEGNPSLVPGSAILRVEVHRREREELLMTTILKKSVQGLAAKLHTIHPGVVLPLVAVGGWLIAPGLGIGDTTSPAPLDQAVAAVDRTVGNLLGSKAADANNPPSATTTGVAALTPAAPATGGGLFGGNQSSGNTGGGGGSGAGSSTPPKPQGQAQASLPAKTTTPSVAAPHPAPWTFPGAQATTTPNTPRVAAMPRPSPPPGTPPVVAMPRPMVPPGPAMQAPPQHVTVVVPPPPAPPPVVIRLPFPPRLVFPRPPVIRAPVVVARRH
jgi:hypothetical protein